jgi:eukaryotic-like serine/threonine-protein kinase
MKTKNWQSVNEIVLDALELEREQRPAFILEKCGDSPDIRREVESLLKGEIDAENLFWSPAVANYASFFERDFEPEALVGQKIGNYRVIREIGWGGMGAVYLAERSDGKFEQQVALKLLKREFNTSALRRRFQQERAILASLHHPNIARLLDAGATREKIPFLAMEYVEGLPIDEYCSKNDLDLAQRLELFRDVCAAVDFAHRSLVIHRDLKPSNILVTNDGIPKLLDFGISKILDTNIEVSESKTITRLGVMTPSYASPEQAKNESVTIATDVYSLGVILYELLCGKRPFEFSENDLTAIYRSVIEVEPSLPSSVVEQLAIPRSVVTDNQNGSRHDTRSNQTRQTIPRIKAIKAQYLRGDLDNIVIKALKKEPERRYSNVANFSEDIGRYQSGMPVTARPDTFGYRAHKFVNRNRTAVVAAMIVILAIVAGIAATFWQASRAAAERDRARSAAEKAQKINSYLQNVLNFSNPHWLSSNPKRNRDATVAQAMDEALKNIDMELAGEPEIQAEILFTLCQSYSSQGEYSKAMDLARRAIDKFDASLGTPNSKSMQASVILADILYVTGKFDEAETLYINAIDFFRPKLAEEGTAKWLAIALNDLGNIHIMKAKFSEAETVILEATELAQTITGKDRFILPTVLGNRAYARQYLGDFKGYLDYSILSLDAMRNLGTGESFESGNAHLNIGRAHTLLNNFVEAAIYHKKANDLFVATVGDDNVYTQSNRYHTANNLLKQERYAEARSLIEKTIAVQRKLFPDGHFTINFSRRLLGDIFTKTGDLKKGEVELRAALEAMAKSVKEPNHEISLMKTSLGENLIAQKRMDEASETLASALDGYLKTRGDNNPFTERCRALLNSIPTK